MSRHDDRISLQQMLDHAAEAWQMAHARAREDLDSDRQFELAVVHLLLMVGEAASRVSAPTRSSCPEIPWREVIAARNRLIHGYDRINHDVVWKILRDDLPLLIDQLREAVGRLQT